MPQTASLGSGLRTFTPDFNAVGWQVYGAGALGDGSDASGYLTDYSDPDASLAQEYADNRVVPDTAKINRLDLVVRVGTDALIRSAAEPVHPYMRYVDGAPSFQAAIVFPYAIGFGNFTAQFFADPTGTPWTRRSIYAKNGKLLRFGVRTSQDADGQPSDVKLSNLEVFCNFTLRAPTVQTTGATSVGGTTAQLNGLVNPEGTNSYYPFSYFFEYGLTTDYGSSTTPQGGLTGSADVAVSASVSGLTQGVTYHFRVVVTTPEGTFYGDDLTFATDASATPGRWRLDEFKRLPTGTFTSADRTRQTSEGFDRSSGLSDAAACPELVLE